MTLRDLFTLFDQYNRNNLKAGTAAFYEGRLRPVLAIAGDLEAAELRPAHLLAFRQTWHLILAVQRLFRWAKSYQLADNPAILGLKRPRLGRRRRVLGRADLLRLMRSARADYRRLLLGARETAARPLELRELAWEQLQLPEGIDLADALAGGLAWFELAEFKARSRRSDHAALRTVPISPRLGRLLLRLSRGEKRSGLIFRTDAGQAWTYSATRCRLRRLRRRAGLGGAVGGEKICQYTLRHSAATAWAARGLQTSVIQGLLGQADVKTTQRYLHLSRGQILEAWRKFQQGRGK